MDGACSPCCAMRATASTWGRGPRVRLARRWRNAGEGEAGRDVTLQVSTGSSGRRHQAIRLLVARTWLTLNNGRDVRLSRYADLDIGSRVGSVAGTGRAVPGEEWSDQEAAR